MCIICWHGITVTTTRYSCGSGEVWKIIIKIKSVIFSVFWYNIYGGTIEKLNQNLYHHSSSLLLADSSLVTPAAHHKWTLTLMLGASARTKSLHERVKFYSEAPNVWSSPTSVSSPRPKSTDGARLVESDLRVQRRGVDINPRPVCSMRQTRIVLSAAWMKLYTQGHGWTTMNSGRLMAGKVIRVILRPETIDEMRQVE